MKMTKSVHIRIPEYLYSEIEQRAGKGKVSEFVRIAIQYYMSHEMTQLRIKEQFLQDMIQAYTKFNKDTQLFTEKHIEALTEDLTETQKQIEETAKLPAVDFTEADKILERIQENTGQEATYEQIEYIALNNNMTYNQLFAHMHNKEEEEI